MTLASSEERWNFGVGEDEMQREPCGPVADVGYPRRMAKRAVVICVQTGVHDHAAERHHPPNAAADRQCPFMFNGPVGCNERERSKIPPASRKIIEDDGLKGH